MPATPKVRILFVCLGNICRSPAAEGVFRHLVAERGLGDQVFIDSAGVGAWHVGEAPDRRMRQTAARYGISLDGQHARQLKAPDLASFDFILAMDRQNLRDIQRLDAQNRHQDKIRLFRSFDPEPEDQNVPDPYFGGAQGFENVYRMVERTSRALLAALVEQYTLNAQEQT